MNILVKSSALVLHDKLPVSVKRSHGHGVAAVHQFRKVVMEVVHQGPW